MTKEFQGKSAIVTGGGTGIGRAVSELLAQRGASVAVIYSRSQQEAEETVQSIRQQGGEAISVQADVADSSSVQSMVEVVVEAFGGLHYLVNNAGITRQLRFDDLDSISEDVWDSLMAVNVKGTFNCSRAAAPHLRQHPGSAIVNVGSIAGETGYGSSLPYAVSKSAVHGLTKSLARALAPVDTSQLRGTRCGGDQMVAGQRREDVCLIRTPAVATDINARRYCSNGFDAFAGRINDGANYKAENGQTL